MALDSRASPQQTLRSAVSRRAEWRSEPLERVGHHVGNLVVRSPLHVLTPPRQFGGCADTGRPFEPRRLADGDAVKTCKRLEKRVVHAPLHHGPGVVQPAAGRIRGVRRACARQSAASQGISSRSTCGRAHRGSVTASRSRARAAAPASGSGRRGRIRGRCRRRRVVSAPRTRLSFPPTLRGEHQALAGPSGGAIGRTQLRQRCRQSPNLCWNHAWSCARVAARSRWASVMPAMHHRVTYAVLHVKLMFGDTSPQLRAADVVARG